MTRRIVCLFFNSRWAYMTRNSREQDSGKAVEMLWRRLDEAERDILSHFICIPPPVSIDILTSLSGASAIAVLNLMEKLKRIDGAFEKKGMARGLYFMRDNGLAEFVRSHVADDRMNSITRRVIGHIRSSSIQ